jgi:hypothetical protein
MNGSAHADAFPYQDAYHSYMHGMSSDVLSKKDSQKKYCQYIKDMMAKYQSMLGANQNTAAFWYLGRGLHAVMDSTSPAHSGFQKWSSSEVGRHGSKKMPWSKNSEEDIDTALKYRDLTLQKMKDAMLGGVDGCSCN